jgi:hypothetical protein
LGRPELTTWDGKNPQLELVRSLAMAPPGGYHVVTMLGKQALKMPPYRYSIANLKPGGLQVTEERRDLAAEMDFSSPDSNPQLSALGAQLLKDARLAAQEKGIRLVYVLPWSYWPQDTVNERRTANAALLKTIGRHVPALIEPSMGAHSQLKDFTDSGQHLTAEAAAARSSVLAETLKADRGSSNHQ